MRKIVIAGGTGMIGKLILDRCIKDQRIDQLVSIVRKPTNTQHHKLKEIIVEDLTNYNPDPALFSHVSTIFCCIGVYTGEVEREAFRKITTEIPVALGKLVYQYSPNAKYCFLSGSGADRTEKSRMMFAEDKGAAENQLANIGFSAFHTFRPAYIYPVTPRKEPNFTYRLSRNLYPFIKLLGSGASVPSTKLAKAMFKVGINKNITKEIFENKDILKAVKEI